MEKRANETKQNKNKHNPEPVPFVRDFPQAGGQGGGQTSLTSGNPRVGCGRAGYGDTWASTDTAIHHTTPHHDMRTT